MSKNRCELITKIDAGDRWTIELWRGDVFSTEGHAAYSMGWQHGSMGLNGQRFTVDSDDDALEEFKQYVKETASKEFCAGITW